MANYFYGSGMMGYGLNPSWLVFMPIVLIWSLFWKGLALWHSAKRNNAWWFLVLLILNTAGILEIIYLFAVIKVKKGELFPKFMK